MVSVGKFPVGLVGYGGGVVMLYVLVVSLRDHSLALRGDFSRGTVQENRNAVTGSAMSAAVLIVGTLLLFVAIEGK